MRLQPNKSRPLMCSRTSLIAGRKGRKVKVISNPNMKKKDENANPSSLQQKPSRKKENDKLASRSGGKRQTAQGSVIDKKGKTILYVS